MSKKHDLFFALSLVLMVFIAIHLVDHYLQKQDMNNYLNVLGDKISAMIPDNEKDEFNSIYASFVKQVEEEDVPATELAELANRIVEMRKESETISAAKVREILPVSRNRVLIENANWILPKPEIGLKWDELARDFETAYKTSDSIRIKKEHHIKLKNNIAQQLELHSDITTGIETNYYDALDKVEILKDKIEDVQVQRELIKKIEVIKSENQTLNKKISALAEIKKVIALERKRLQEELKEIDSTHSHH